MLKHLLYKEIPYWENKKLSVNLYWNISDKNPDKKCLMLCIGKLRRLIDIKEYEDEWGINWWKFFRLWRKL